MTNFKKKYWFFLLIPVFLFLLSLLDGNYLFSFLALAACLFLFFLFLKIEIGLYLTAFSLPFIGIAFKINFLELPLVDLLALFTLLAFILRELYFYLYNKKKTEIIYPFFVYFLFFFLICLLSSFFSQNILSSIWYSFRWILFFYLAFIFVPANIIKDGKILRKVIILISTSSLILALFGLGSLFFQDWQDSFFRVQSMPVFGYWIFGNNYNLLAEILLSSGFIVLSLKHWYKSQRATSFLNLFSLILIMTAWLSFGRTAWLSILLQIILYFSIYFLLIKEKKIDLKVIFTGLIIFLVIASPFIFKMLSLQEANISSTQNRMLLTEISVKAFLNKPLLGYGSGNFVNLVSDNIRFVSKYGDPLDSHGVWQKILAENGMLGIVGFALFSFVIFRRMYLGVLRNKKDYQLLLPLFVASFGVYFYQFFNTSYYKGRIWLPITLCLVAVFLIEKRNKLQKNVK